MEESSDSETDQTPSHPCSLCDKVYSHKSGLSRHKTSVHGSSLQSASCGSLNAGASSLQSASSWKSSQQPLCSSVEPESRGDSNENVFTCNVCNKVYSHASSLSRHKKEAHSDSEYTCPNCNKSFPRNESLVRHIDQGCKGSEPPQKWICSLCDKTWQSEWHLDRHFPSCKGKCHICRKPRTENHVCKLFQVKWQQGKAAKSNPKRPKRHKLSEVQEVEVKSSNGEMSFADIEDIVFTATLSCLEPMDLVRTLEQCTMANVKMFQDKVEQNQWEESTKQLFAFNINEYDPAKEFLLLPSTPEKVITI